jgi:hypothetical protein
MVLALGLLFAGVGLIAFIRGVMDFRTGRASGSWLSTRGEIVVAKVEVRQSAGSGGRARRRYTPHVEYSYTVDGQQYRFVPRRIIDHATAHQEIQTPRARTPMVSVSPA